MSLLAVDIYVTFLRISISVLTAVRASQFRPALRHPSGGEYPAEHSRHRRPVFERDIRLQDRRAAGWVCDWSINWRVMENEVFIGNPLRKIPTLLRQLACSVDPLKIVTMRGVMQLMSDAQTLLINPQLVTVFEGPGP